MQVRLTHSCLIAYISLFSIFIFTASISSAAESRYKPYILAQDQAQGETQAIIASIKQKLTTTGFEIIGHYSPYNNTHILIITNNALRRYAGQSKFGGFGAIQRVSITKTNTGVQVSYTNPVYMAHAYRMKSDLADIKAKLIKALGRQSEYGSSKGLSKKELRNYQYEWLMPYFHDRLSLVEYKTHPQAISQVEQLLRSKTAGVEKVYRVDIPGKQQTVIGVRLNGLADDDCGADKYIMSRIDFKAIKSTGHLPYEIMISKGKVYALYAEFRIAISFPDLTMVGKNSFASIICAPAAIETKLIKAAGGNPEF